LSKTKRCFIATVFKFALEHAIRKFQENQVGVKLNGTHRLLVYADDMNLLGDINRYHKENNGNEIDASKEIGLGIHAEKSKYMLLSRHQNAGQNRAAWYRLVNLHIRNE
jgi:hypothetical protein